MSLLSDPVPPRTTPQHDAWLLQQARLLCMAKFVEQFGHTTRWPCESCRAEAKRMVEQ